MIKISPLFSGSKGNCTLIRSDNANILLDIGYGYKQIVAALGKHGISEKDVDGIVITHEHSDHISALQYWARANNTTVYAPKPISDYISQRSFCSNVTAIEGDFAINDVEITPYVCSHDSRCCFGYRFDVNGKKVASVTDTGIVNTQLIDFLSSCETIQLESNHDENMLWNGNYPYFLKRRIFSDYGHLSNSQTATVLSEIARSNVKNVILAHLSEQNNTKELAFNSALEILTKKGLVEGKDISIYVADQYENGIIL